MDLTYFLAAMKQIERLGPLEGLLKMLPGVNTKMLKQAKAADPKRLKHVEAIVLSMTLEERKKPELMNGSRRSLALKSRAPEQVSVRAEVSTPASGCEAGLRAPANGSA